MPCVTCKCLTVSLSLSLSLSGKGGLLSICLSVCACAVVETDKLRPGGGPVGGCAMTTRGEVAPCDVFVCAFVCAVCVFEPTDEIALADAMFGPTVCERMRLVVFGTGGGSRPETKSIQEQTTG